MRQKIIYPLRDAVLLLLNFFYTPFKKFIPWLTFRYAVAGASNVLWGYSVYYVVFKWILKGTNLHLGFYELKSHVAALAASFCCQFPVGFFMAKFVVFTDSDMKGKVQLFRYFMVCLLNLLLNYVLLKIFVEVFHIYPTIAQILTVAIIVLFSYLAQRHFSFKVKPDDLD